MESEGLRFAHVGLSSDGAVVFCEMEDGSTYAMPLNALKQAEDWDARAKPKTAGILHDGFAAFVEFDSGVKIDFPCDFVLHVCEPSYAFYKKRGRAISGVGRRIREIRKTRGLTLDALSARCGIAKPNLSRLENDKVTPKFETLNAIAAGLRTHPVLLVSAKKPEEAWAWTKYQFDNWKLSFAHVGATSDRPLGVARGAEMVDTFLALWPEHGYARSRLLHHARRISHNIGESVLAEEWQRQQAAAHAAQVRAKRKRFAKSSG